MIGILYLIAFECFGVVTAYRVFRERHTSTRIWLGLVTGLIEMMWFPSLFAFALDFSMPAQQYSLALSGLIACACALLPLTRRAREITPKGKRVPPVLLIAVVVPVTLLMGYLQYTHTLREIDGALNVGQSTYGDLCMHLSFATGLIGQSYPPEYTLLPGTVLGYPFLADALSSTMILLGTPVALSFTMPGTLMTMLIAWGFVTFAWEICKSRLAVALACLLFFLNGGLGFVYQLDKIGLDSSALQNALTEFYMTPTNMPSYNLRWVNALCDLVLPQRTLMAGWMCLMPALYLLTDGIATRDKRTFFKLGVLAGALPMIHTHTFLALGLISAGAVLYCAARDRRNLVNLIVYGLIAVVLALPQLLLWTFPQTLSGGALRFHFNWVNNESGLIDGYLWFWIKNVGPVFLLFLPAALNVKKRHRPLALGALVLFVAAELVLFQPNAYDNNKLFFVAFILMLPLTAGFIVKCLGRLRGVRGRYLILAVFMVVSTLSGAISIARECVSSYQLFTSEQTQAARFIERNTPEDAVILTSTQHNNAVTSLAGRKIVCGSSIYLFYHGLDYSRQYTDQVLMFAFPEKYGALFEAYNVDYIFVSPYERAPMSADASLIYDPANRRETYTLDIDAIRRLFPLVEKWGEGYELVELYAVSARAKYFNSIRITQNEQEITQ